MKKYISAGKEAVRKFHDSFNHPPPIPQRPPHEPPHQCPAPQTGDGPDLIQQPTPLDILRYRYHHGCNLGSIYVLEKWLFPSMFPPNAPNNVSSELEGVKASVAARGMDATRAMWEKHWNEAVSDSDWDWLVNVARCTTIRLPIGYFTLGPCFVQNTPFAPYAPVYTNAWHSVKALCTRARSHGIGILLDFHALPGGANGGEHSGTNSGVAELWTNKSYLALATKCIQFMAEDVRRDGPNSAIVGIQIVNEANWEAPGMYEWYDNVLSATAAIDKSIPIYVSDGWNLGKCLGWQQSKSSVTSGAPPVVVDTHFYWAFTDADKAKTPQQIISEVGTKLGELDGKEGSVIDRGAAQVIVGEYSCVLTEDSWAKSGGASRDVLVKQFGQAQSARYQQRTGGSYFWTYKMDWLPGGEWGFVAQSTPPQAVTPPIYTSRSPQEVSADLQNAATVMEPRMRARVNEHVSYWDRTAPGYYEHWRYENGWKVGWQDAAAFWGARNYNWLGSNRNGADKVAMLDLWARKRIIESGMKGGFVWEFEQGLRAGINDFYLAVNA